MDRNYWVYILECSDGSYYTGVTSNLEQRLSQHRLGIVKGYTSTRLPVKLVFNECFYEVYDAISAEKQIKRWTRVKKEALIRGDFEALKVLAKKKWKKKG